MSLSDRDQVRLMVFDTDAADPLLSDTEVDNFLEQRTVYDSSGGTVSVNIPAAAADSASAIAAKFARQFDFSEDGQSFSLAQRTSAYMALERELRNRSGGYAVSIRGTATT